MLPVEQEQRTARRWMAVGRSHADDAERAGREAAAQAVVGDDVKLLVVIGASSQAGDALLRGIRAVSPDTPLVGCSTIGMIGVDGEAPTMVAVIAIGGEGFSVVPAVSRDVSRHVHEAGVELARSLATLPDPPYQVLLMLMTDDLAGTVQELLRGAYTVVGGAVPMVGGCAGGSPAHASHQYFGDEVLTDAAVAVALGSDAPIGIGIEHGCQLIGEPMLVTRSDGRVLYELDDQPALDVYLDRLAAPEDVRRDPEAFGRFALTHPLGLAGQRGAVARHTVGADFEARAVVFAADIPEGGMAWFMEEDATSITDSTRVAVATALDGLDGRAPLGLLAFDCVARQAVLGGEESTAALESVAEHARGTPVAGFHTFGEIARVRGINGYHNQTIVVLALS